MIYTLYVHLTYKILTHSLQSGQLPTEDPMFTATTKPSKFLSMLHDVLPPKRLLGKLCPDSLLWTSFSLFWSLIFLNVTCVYFALLLTF